MQDQSRVNVIILGMSLLLGLSVLGFLLGNAAFKVKSLERTVTVKGLSEREVPANVVAWPITFQAASNDLDALFDSVEVKSKTVITFLGEHGISRDAISLSPPVVADLYAQQWGDKKHIKFRYTATASVTVYSKNVEAVRKAMADVLSLGKRGVAIGGSASPGVGGNRFLFTELNALKPQMIEEATKNARTVAKKFAADSNSRLGKIKSARQGQFSISNRDATTPHIKKIRVVSTIEYYLTD